MRSADLIYNPNAGRFPSGILAERAADVLREYGWKIRLIKTRSGEHITQLACRAAEAGKDALFAVGGDGTVNMAVRGLVGSDTALGVIPAGTGNVLAQELGLPGLSWTRLLALEESARLLADATVHEVDIGLCGDTPFINWAGVGIDAFAIHHMEPRPRSEKLFSAISYAATAVWQASSWHGINLRVTADRLHISGHYLLAVVSNIHLYAGGLAEISPSALLDDGINDLWLFEGDTIADVIGRAWDLLNGKHVESDKVRRIPFTEVTLESDQRLYIQLDAEPVPYDGKVIEIKVVPKWLKLLIPIKTPRALFVEDKNKEMEIIDEVN